MFRKLSLRQRLILIIFATSVLSLAFAGVALFFLESHRTRQNLAKELESLAVLLGNRSSAALAFRDDRTAQENLESLSRLPQIGAACIFDENQLVFASYRHSDFGHACVLLKPISERHSVIQGSHFVIQHPILIDQQLHGTIQLMSTDKPLRDRLLEQAISLALALQGALLLAVLLALRLQRVISQPIGEIRDVANAIIDSGDYSLRAPDLGENELGKLSSAFNRMLDTIATQNSALAQSEAYTRRLFYDSHVAQVVLDLDSMRCIDGNQAAVQLYGVANLESLIGMRPADLSAPYQYDGSNSSEAAMQVREKLIDNGTLAFEWWHRRPDGSLWDASVHLMEFSLRNQRLVHLSIEDITQRRRDEKALHELNQRLEERVAARTRELAEANAQLQSTLDSLQRTQHELVQQEKLASLGALVAGVAHELNTPLGNSVTVCSTLEDMVKNLSSDIERGTLKRSSLTQNTESLRSGLVLLTRNLERASDLVTHFKQVAVDQTSAMRRIFDLASTISDIVETLEPQFKVTPHHIEVDVPADISMDSFPGPLGQIITNLVLNSLIHGFSPDMRGVVLIACEHLGHQEVVLRISDNGCGIPAKNVPHIFDPFFTTRLGQGGSGLGLHIVFNLTVSTLGGSIHFEPATHPGASFVLRMPRIAPHRQLDEAGNI